MNRSLIAAFTLLLSGICLAETPEFYMGTTTHFGQNKGVPGQNLDMARQAGIISIRDEVSWRSVEQRKGELKIPDSFGKYLDEAVKRGIQPLIILDYGNRFYDEGSYPASDEAIEGYARYCEAIVRYAGDRAKLFQVWNEWDGGCGMNRERFGRGTAEGYMKVLKTVYPRLKKIAPEATIISNSVCTGEKFLEDTFKLGVLDSCDAIGFHTYNYSRGYSDPVENWLERMKNLRVLIHKYNNGKDKPVCITEMGWPNHLSASGSTEAESAIKLAKLYLYARTLPFVKGVWWYDLQDDGWDARYIQHNFGLLRADLTPKSPYYAMKSLSKRVSQGKFLGSETRDGILLLRFRDADGEFLAAVNQLPNVDLQLIFDTDQPNPSPVVIEQVGSAPVKREWGFRDWPAKKSDVIANRFSVTVTEMPVMLSGGLEKAKIAEVIAHPFARNTMPGKGILRLPSLCAEVLKTGESSNPMSFRNYQKLAAPEYGGDGDLSADFRCNYDRDTLYLTITVKDNVFHQAEKTIADAWRGDGLQLAFQTADADGVASRTELDAALVDGKPEVMIREAQGNRDKKPECTVERKGAVTVYRLEIPAQLLGTKAFEPGAMLACAFLVNDDDGSGRKGFLTWGKGIGLGKDPSLYNLLIFK